MTAKTTKQKEFLLLSLSLSLRSLSFSLFSLTLPPNNLYTPSYVNSFPSSLVPGHPPTIHPQSMAEQAKRKTPWTEHSHRGKNVVTHKQMPTRGSTTTRGAATTPPIPFGTPPAAPMALSLSLLVHPFSVVALSLPPPPGGEQRKMRRRECFFG